MLCKGSCSNKLKRLKIFLTGWNSIEWLDLDLSSFLALTASSVSTLAPAGTRPLSSLFCFQELVGMWYSYSPEYRFSLWLSSSDGL